MKKLLALSSLVTIATLSSVTASANNNSGWYVGTDVGYSKYKVKENELNFSGEMSQTLIVGKELNNNVRVAVDFTNYGTHAEVYSIEGDSGVYKLDVLGLGVSAIYDFKNQSVVTPYVGARLAINNMDTEDSYGPEHSYTRLGYGALAGVQVKVAEPVAINVGMEYNRLLTVDDVSLDQYGAKAGVVYKF